MVENICRKQQQRPSLSSTRGGEGNTAQDRSKPSSSSTSWYSTCMATDVPASGTIGQECGYLFGDKWISVNDLVDWLLQQEDVGWPSIQELITMAATRYANFVVREAIFMSKQAGRVTSEVVNKARRWSERRAKSSSSASTGQVPTSVPVSAGVNFAEPHSTSSTLLSTKEQASGIITTSPASASDPTEGTPAVQPSSSSSSSSHVGRYGGTQSVVGFYRHGVFVPRERTDEERRWQQGGQGPARTARRAARLEQWQRGDWLPAWLRNYQTEKAQRDAAREARQQKDNDESGFLQARLLYGDHGASLTGDEFSLMDVGLPRAGLQAEERERLSFFGISQERQRQLDAFLQTYEQYQAIDLGAEARWALAKWLQKSQVAAGLQDECEDVIRARAQSTTCYPLRREPLDVHLRQQLFEWVDQLTPMMGEIFMQGVSLGATPSTTTLTSPTPPSSSSSGAMQRRPRSPSRSRSPKRDGTSLEGDEVTFMEVGDRRRTASTPPPDDLDMESEEEEVEDFGYGETDEMPAPPSEMMGRF